MDEHGLQKRCHSKHFRKNLWVDAEVRRVLM